MISLLNEKIRRVKTYAEIFSILYSAEYVRYRGRFGFRVLQNERNLLFEVLTIVYLESWDESTKRPILIIAIVDSFDFIKEIFIYSDWEVADKKVFDLFSLYANKGEVLREGMLVYEDLLSQYIRSQYLLADLRVKLCDLLEEHPKKISFDLYCGNELLLREQTYIDDALFNRIVRERLK